VCLEAEALKRAVENTAKARDLLEVDVIAGDDLRLQALNLDSQCRRLPHKDLFCRTRHAAGSPSPKAGGVHGDGAITLTRLSGLDLGRRLALGSAPRTRGFHS
jgi:hypothetical protein